MTALPAWRQRLAAVAVLMPHSFSVRLEPDDARWIRARSAVMAVHESNFHAPCCEACGKEWGKTVPTAESDPFVMVLSKLHVHPAYMIEFYQNGNANGLGICVLNLCSRVKRDRLRNS